MRLHGVLLGLVILTPALAQPPAAPDPDLDRRIERLIRDLDALAYRDREAASRALWDLRVEAEPALNEALKRPLNPDARRRILTLLNETSDKFAAESNGWYMVGQSIAHAQSFKATGTTVLSLQLRVATPAGQETPLDVDIRDAAMEKVFARGAVNPKMVETKFTWQQVEWSHRAPLTPGATYRIVFHSKTTTKPWVVNAVYKPVYPHGEHVGHPLKDNLFFRLGFRDGKSIHVGPALDAGKVEPINGGVQAIPPNFNIANQGLRLDFNAGGVPDGTLVK